jgi:hypothetical protein
MSPKRRARANVRRSKRSANKSEDAADSNTATCTTGEVAEESKDVKSSAPIPPSVVAEPTNQILMEEKKAKAPSPSASLALDSLLTWVKEYQQVPPLFNSSSQSKSIEIEKREAIEKSPAVSGSTHLVPSVIRPTEPAAIIAPASIPVTTPASTPTPAPDPAPAPVSAPAHVPILVSQTTIERERWLIPIRSLCLAVNVDALVGEDVAQILHKAIQSTFPEFRLLSCTAVGGPALKCAETEALKYAAQISKHSYITKPLAIGLEAHVEFVDVSVSFDPNAPKRRVRRIHLSCTTSDVTDIWERRIAPAEHKETPASPSKWSFDITEAHMIEALKCARRWVSDQRSLINASIWWHIPLTIQAGMFGQREERKGDAFISEGMPIRALLVDPETKREVVQGIGRSTWIDLDKRGSTKADESATFDAREGSLSLGTNPVSHDADFCITFQHLIGDSKPLQNASAPFQLRLISAH